MLPTGAPEISPWLCASIDALTAAPAHAVWVAPLGGAIIRDSRFVAGWARNRFGTGAIPSDRTRVLSYVACTWRPGVGQVS